MDPKQVTFGSEARQFMKRYELREDAVRYARAHAVVSWEDGEVMVVEGHGPDNRRYRLSCVVGREEHVLTVRPVG